MPRDSRQVSKSGDDADTQDRARLLAFLVDGDNAMASLIEPMLEEVSKYGTSIIRRVYGDWTKSTMQAWRSVLQEHALSPAQQFANVSGKNATDSALIIEAMDMLHNGVVDGFCIVSSDSDYTSLAKRIREEGLFVMGIGRAATPAAFRNACRVFVATENLAPAESMRKESRRRSGRRSRERESRQPEEMAAEEAPPASGNKLPPAHALRLLRKAFDATVNEDGRAPLASMGLTLRRLDPAFDTRTYGKSKLMSLLEALKDDFTIEKPRDSSDTTVFVKLKQ